MQTHSLCMAFWVSLALTACTQGAHSVAPSSASSGQNTGLAQAAPIRVILQLRSSSAAFASTAFLQQLQTQTGASVHYIVSVSNDTHVYSFAPAPGQNYAQIAAKLYNMPVVSQVTLDQKMPPQ